MTGPVYLYSYGKRRHIADPVCDLPPRAAYRLTLCGELHEPEAEMRLRFTSALASDTARRAINRKLAEPMCKRCEQKWALS